MGSNNSGGIFSHSECHVQSESRSSGRRVCVCVCVCVCVRACKHTWVCAKSPFRADDGLEHGTCGKSHFCLFSRNLLLPNLGVG